MPHEKNNFDFLRIFAAYLVLFSHQFSLTGHPQPSVAGYQTLGGLALNIFFSISGYLVAQSWNHDPNPFRFAARRFLRIWPGLAVMVLLVAGLWAPLVTTRPVREYFTNLQTLEFLKAFWLSFAYRLPGVFDSNPLPYVNGSLWTLAIEARWYLYLLVFGMVGLLRFRIALLVLWLGMAVRYFFFYDVERAATHGGDRWWNTELGLFFLAGVCLYVYRDFWQTRVVHVAGTVLVLCTGLFIGGYRFAAFTLFMAFFVIWFGTRSTPCIRQSGRYGDLSYGVYIYAFVIQQTVIDVTGNSLSIANGFYVSAFLTGLLGFASWHLVEKQALKLKSKLPQPKKDQRIPLAADR
jgi:peptidoglycan/LPS O-acetylase OafA/YrhL